MHVQVAEQAYTQAQAMVATQDAGGAQSAGPGPDSAAAAQQNPGEVSLHVMLPVWPPVLLQAMSPGSTDVQLIKVLHKGRACNRPSAPRRPPARRWCDRS